MSEPVPAPRGGAAHTAHRIVTAKAKLQAQAIEVAKIMPTPKVSPLVTRIATHQPLHITATTTTTPAPDLPISPASTSASTSASTPPHPSANVVLKVFSASPKKEEASANRENRLDAASDLLLLLGGA